MMSDHYKDFTDQDHRELQAWFDETQPVVDQPEPKLPEGPSDTCYDLFVL